MSSSTALTTNDETDSLVALFGDLTSLSNYVYRYDATALICGESWDRTGQDGVLKVSHVSVPVTIEGRDGKVRLTESSAFRVMQEYGQLAQSLMFSADPDFGGKELDMSFFQRRYEMLRPPPLLEAWGLMIVERRPEQPPYTVAHEASHTVCPTVGHAAAAMNTALRWSIDSNDEFEIQVRSVRNDPTDHPRESCARAARWFTDPTQMENHRFKTLHSQAGVWGRGPIPDAVLTISVAESNDQAERWQLMRQKNEREYQTHAESLAQSRATSVAGEDTQTRSSKQVTFSEPDDTTGDGSSDDTTDEGSSDDATVDGWPDDDQL